MENEARKEEADGWRRRRKRRKRRPPQLLLLPLAATFCISLPLSLHFAHQLVPTFFQPGHQPPLPLFFPLRCCRLPSRPSSPRRVNPQQPLQSRSPSVCLAVGRRRLPLGDLVTFQLVRRGSANEPLDARTSQLARIVT